MVVKPGIQIDLRIGEAGRSFGALLQYFTGSQPAQHPCSATTPTAWGLSLNEYGITTMETGKVETVPRRGVLLRPPGAALHPARAPLAEMSELEAARERFNLPDLVTLADIRGDLHLHSEWSDGDDPPRGDDRGGGWPMGCEYMALTDHSQGLGVANGLTPWSDWPAQIEILLHSLREPGIDITILCGSEVDIRSDGRHGLPGRRFWNMLDCGGRLGPQRHDPGASETMTRRVIRAMEHPARYDNRTCLSTRLHRPPRPHPV